MYEHLQHYDCAKKKERVIYTETNTLGNYIVWYL